jgi:flagellar hook-associated protein 1
MPNISSLNTAFSGMNAQRKILDVTAHNIANSTVEGYHRQRVDLQSLARTGTTGVFSGVARTNGVEAIGVTRSYDEILASRAARENATRGNTESMKSTMTAIEAAFPEPGDTGIAHQMDLFWNAWSALAIAPASAPARQEVLSQAATLTSSLNRAAGDLQSVSDAATTRTIALAGQVNSLAQQLVDVNRSVMTSGNDNPDLLDQRDSLAGQISVLTGSVTRIRANGTADVTINNRALVADSIIQPLTVTGGVLAWSLDGAPVVAPAGEAAGLNATVVEVVPRYRAALDAVAAQLVTSVNTLHTAGYDQAGTTGRNFFDPAAVTAATITLSIDVIGQPANIGAGAPLPGGGAPGTLDGGQARALGRLADATTGAAASYRSLVGGLASETKAATSRAAIQDQAAEAAIRDAASVGSVSIDEEMTTMVAAQRAFEANARVITVIDDMLGFLIERTGMVGR